MAVEKHLSVLDLGVQAWNVWRRLDPARVPDLQGANLWRRRLTEIDFSNANLVNANLSGAILSLGSLKDADLSGANLLGAIVSGVGASGANFTDASLTETNFNQSDLRCAILTGAILYETNFANVDLSGAKGLETCIHLRPSTLDHRTLARSGSLPVEFLQGCGVPQFMIDHMQVFKHDPIQFYSCFISYSSQDEEFVQRLYTDLQKAGVRSWFAREDMPIGVKIRPSIDQAISGHDKLMLILSRTSVRSQWVEQEVEKALERERTEDKLVIFPIRIDDAVFEVSAGWASALKNSRHIGDFKDWREPDGYTTAFQRLLRDLRAAN